jgi:hypothetical protein
LTDGIRWNKETLLKRAKLLDEAAEASFFTADYADFTLTSLDLGRIRHFWSEEGWSIVDTRLLQCGNKQQKHYKTRQNKVTW